MALRSAAGFSLIELLIVIAMLLCLIAISLPSVMHSVAALRCRLTMTGLSGVVQQCRSYAIKSNKNMGVHFATSGGQTIAYIADPGASTLASAVDSREMAMGQGVKLVAKPTGSNAPPELTGTFMWGANAPNPASGDMSFNSRGLPCYLNAANSPPTCDPIDPAGNGGYVYYFTYQPPVGENGWSALSISPAGRIKIWTASGNTWMSN